MRKLSKFLTASAMVVISINLTLVDAKAVSKKELSTNSIKNTNILGSAKSSEDLHVNTFLKDYFPDINFRTYVFKEVLKNQDTNTMNDYKLKLEDIEKIYIYKSMDLNTEEYKEISNLEGIHYFRELSKLDCRNTKITNLDLSQNGSLQFLNCSELDIKELDLSNNNLLEQVFASNLNLKTLNLGESKHYVEIDISGTTIEDKKLDVTKNPTLQLLWVQNTNIDKLDITHNTNLNRLYSYKTNIKDLDFSNSPNLDTIWISMDTKYKSIDTNKTLVMRSDDDKEISDIIGWKSEKDNSELGSKDLPSNSYRGVYDAMYKSNGDGGGSVDPKPSKTVILASGEKYTDVLASTVLGNEKDAPILLSKKDSVDSKTINEIQRLNADEIIISGGTNSISEKVVSQLSNYKVTRISGKDRYETAEKIGDEIRKTGDKDGAVLVDGTNFADVITMSSLASGKRIPILLTEPKDLNSTTKDTLGKWGIKDITIGGGYNSVSKKIEDNLEKNKVTTRLGGVDRYDTAQIIASQLRNLTENRSDMILVDGTDYPDGITISSLSANFRAPILLTKPDKLTKITEDKLTEWSIKNILIGGGYNSVSKSIEDQLNVSKKERVAGANRYETAVKISQRLSNINTPIGDK